MNLDRRIEKATRQQGLYRAVLGDLESLSFDIKQTGYLSEEHYRRFLRATDMLRLAADDDDPTQSVRRIKKLQRQVLREMPAEKPWVPTIGPEASVA